MATYGFCENKCKHELDTVKVSSTEPTNGEKVWIDDKNKKIHLKDEENNFKEFADLNSKYKLLWENSNPNSQFDGSKNINLDSDDYDLLIWFYKRDIEVDFVASNTIPKGYGGHMGYVNTYDGQNSAFREITRINDTTFQISSAFKGTTEMENTQIIPIKVLGVKF